MDPKANTNGLNKQPEADYLANALSSIEKARAKSGEPANPSVRHEGRNLLNLMRNVSNADEWNFRPAGAMEAHKNPNDYFRFSENVPKNRNVLSYNALLERQESSLKREAASSGAFSAQFRTKHNGPF